MKLLVQRVEMARVSVSGNVSGAIDSGLFVLVGFKKGDTKDMVEALARKLFNLRVMSDTENKMNLSVAETSSDILVVSQFTLYADSSKGNRPSFVKAEDPEKARELYKHFVDHLRSLGARVETGSFGDFMEIDAKLSGPFTIMLES